MHQPTDTTAAASAFPWSTALRFGLIGGTLTVAITMVAFAWFGHDAAGYRLQEVIGYASILLATSFIFFAIRSDLTRRLDAGLPTGPLRSFSVGLATNGVAALLFGAFNYVFVRWIDPGFTERYMEMSRQQIESADIAPAEKAAQLAYIDDNLALWNNHWFQSFVMFATVFLIGIAVTALSVLVLRLRARARASLGEA